MDLRHDILAIDHDGRPFRRAQRHVQDRTIFRNVDFLTPEHRVDSLAQSGLLGKPDEQAYRLVVDTILRVIQEDAGGLRRHPLATRWISGEQVTQVPPPHCPIVIFESAPRPLSARRISAS